MADRALLGVLVEHIPGADVEADVRDAGRQSKRDRSLPAQMTVMYVVALSLYRGVSCEEVLSYFLEGWRWLDLPDYAVATKGAITQARVRLGKDAVRGLFERIAASMSTPQTRGAYYRNWLTVAFDGTTLSVPDSKQNAAATWTK